MPKQALVVGLGRFGMAVARALAERDVEVLAVDNNERRVQDAAQFVADAVCFDATDEESLARTSPGRRDLCVCAMGDDSSEAAILCTALLRQMGARRIVARASGELRARILRLVGAHEVVNPLREFGERYTMRLLYRDVLGELPLGETLLITEVRLPDSMNGKTLAELALPQRHGITVVAVRSSDERGVRLPAPGDVVDEDDVLIVVSKRGAVAKLMERE